MKYTDVIKMLKRADYVDDRAAQIAKWNTFSSPAARYKASNPAYGVKSPLNDNDYQRIANQVWGQGQAQRAGLTYDDVLNQVRSSGASYRQNAYSPQQVNQGAYEMMRSHPGLSRQNAESMVRDQGNRLAGMGYNLPLNPENYDFSNIDIKAPETSFTRQVDKANAAQEADIQRRINVAQNNFTNITGKAPVISNEEAASMIRASDARQAEQQRQKQQQDQMRYEQFVQQQHNQNQARAAQVNETIARQQQADQARRQAEMNPQPQTRPDTLHASPSTGGRRMQAVEEQRRKDNQDFYSRDAQRKEDALRNGTLPVQGSMSAGVGKNTVSYGQPIQRDQNGQKVSAPRTGAKPVRQSIINGMAW